MLDNHMGVQVVLFLLDVSIHFHRPCVDSSLRHAVLQEAQSYADDNNLLFMETSAKTSMNVNEIFMAIGRFFIYDIITTVQILAFKCLLSKR